MISALLRFLPWLLPFGRCQSLEVHLLMLLGLERVEEEICFAVPPAMRRKRRLCQKAEAPGSRIPVVRAPQHRSLPLRRHLSDLLLTERDGSACSMLCHRFIRGMSNKNVDSCFTPETNIKSTILQMSLGVLGKMIVDPSTILQIKIFVKIN